MDPVAARRIAELDRRLAEILNTGEIPVPPGRALSLLLAEILAISYHGSLPAMPPKKQTRRNEDLFHSTTMTFGEHLDELRKCLVKGLLGVVLMFILVLSVGWADGVIRLIQVPLTQAMKRFYLQQARKEVEQRPGGDPSENFELIGAIQSDDMVPEWFLIDWRKIIETLQSYGLMSDVDVVSGVAAADLMDVNKFCKDVYGNREGETRLDKFIWDHLDEPSRSLIEKCAKGQEEDADAQDLLSKEDIQQLAKSLQKSIISAEEFYESNKAFFQQIIDEKPGFLDRLIDVLGKGEAKRKRAERVEYLVAMLNESKSFREVNRQLLAIAYPESIASGPRRETMLPIILWRPVSEDRRINPRSLNPTEMFMVFIKAAVILSLVLSSPWVLYQAWSFVGAGLYPHEKRYVHVFLPISIALFLAGVSLCFFFVFKYVLDFLFMFNAWMDIEPDMRISEWFGFALFLPLGFGVAFQLPLVMLFMERIGVMSVATYLAKWRIAILVICVISMLLTPADPTSMVLMAVPLVVLYFFGIGLCRFLPRGRNPFKEVDEPA